jgi:predicted nucleic-acid-binding protein
MVVADTNVWARAFLNDDQAQARKARKTLFGGQAQGSVFVPMVVMAELAWVLRAKWERERVLQALEALLQTSGVIVEAPALVREALDACRKGDQGGFADHLIAQVGFANGAREVLTFDRHFARAERVTKL